MQASDPSMGYPPYGWPQPMIPAPVMMQPVAGRPPKSFARAILLTLATTVFSLSLLVNVYLLVWFAVTSSSDAAKTSVVVSGQEKQTIAVIPVTGVINQQTSNQFRRLLGEVESNSNVRAVVIEIDTPGGEVTASDEIHHRLIQFRQSHPDIPVVASMGQMATSGGYYIACGTDYIIAQPSTMTGNIGVLMNGFNLSGLMAKLGIEDATLHSTGADFKDAGSMFRPGTPQERAYIQGLLDDAFGQFKKVVLDGRAGKLTVPIAEAANGKVYMASDALKLGLIDQIGYAEDGYSVAARLAGGLSQMNVVRYEQPQGLWGLLGAENGQQSAAGVNINISPAMIHEIGSPRMMYLWQAP